MKDRFVVKFNLKKVALFSLASVMFTLGGLYFATLPQEELTDTMRLPKGGRIRNKSIIQMSNSSQQYASKQQQMYMQHILDTYHIFPWLHNQTQTSKMPHILVYS